MLANSYFARCSRVSFQPKFNTSKNFTSRLAFPPTRRLATDLNKKEENRGNVGSHEPDFSNYKKTTGLVGLPVLPPKTARLMLIKACERVLAEVRHGIPPEAGYRQQLEETYGQRLKIAQQHQDPRIIEGEIDCGQIEELITQAEDELALMPEIREGKPWEVPAGYQVPVVIRVSNPRLKDKTGATADIPNPFLKPPK